MSYWRPELLEGIVRIFVEGQRKVHQSNEVFIGFLVRDNNACNSDEFTRERKRWAYKCGRTYLEQARAKRATAPNYRPRSEIKATTATRACIQCGKPFVTRYVKDTPTRKAAKYCSKACDRKVFREKLSANK